MSTIEEAREQAREALRDYGRALAAEGTYDLVGAASFMSKTLTSLLDATEPPVIQYADSATVAGLAEKIAGENAELMERLADKPAEDERDALANVLLDGRDADEGLSALRDRILAAGYRKGPRPITDEMVEAGAQAISYIHASSYTDEHDRSVARAVLEAAEEARR